MDSAMTRMPSVAGQFYPRDPLELRETVARYMDDSGVVPAPERVVALVVPHAGYIYSGPTAGFAFARVRAKHVKRVVLLGCSHRFRISHASIYYKGSFVTPLGEFPIDESFAADLAHEVGSVDTEPHLLEHALEVQLPFLAEAIGLVPIVPVLFGGALGPWHEQFGQRLADTLEPDDLVVASTDLSHYLPDSEAGVLDKSTLAAILAKDATAFGRAIHAGDSSACGATAVMTTMAYALARNADDWRVLDYRTSAATSGDCSRVVGYGAVTMERAV